MTDQEGKNKGGRPSKYTPELVEQAQYYLDNFEEYGHAIPSIEGLSLVIDVTRKTIHAWKAENEPEKAAFCDILEKIHTKQHFVLLDNGLKSEFNSAITKLALGKHGFSDQQQVGNQDGKTFQVVIGNDDADCA